MDESSEEWKKKVERLDNAFLFIISLVGLLFTIIQVATEGITGLPEILPLLILGVVVPFYIGYIRGAIECSSLIERARGWAYLTVGVIAYFAFFVESFGVSYDFGFLAYFLIVGFGAFSVYYLEKWFTRLFNIQEKVTNLYAFYGTAVAGVGIAYMSRLIILTYSSLYPTFQYSRANTFQILIAFVVFLTSLAFEKMSRQVLDANQHFDKNQKKKFRRFRNRVFVAIFELFGSLILTFDKKQRIFLSQVIFFGFVSVFFERAPILQDLFFLISVIFYSLLVIQFLRSGKTDFSSLGKSIVED